MQMISAEDGVSFPYASCAMTGTRTKSGYCQEGGRWGIVLEWEQTVSTTVPRDPAQPVLNHTLLGNLTHSHSFNSLLQVNHSHRFTFILDLLLGF